MSEPCVSKFQGEVHPITIEINNLIFVWYGSQCESFYIFVPRHGEAIGGGGGT